MMWCNSLSLRRWNEVYLNFWNACIGEPFKTCQLKQLTQYFCKLSVEMLTFPAVQSDFSAPLSCEWGQQFLCSISGLWQSCFLLADFGGHSLGSLLSHGRWQRADPDGDRLWNCPSLGSSPQPPGSQSPGEFGSAPQSVLLQKIFAFYSSLFKKKPLKLNF